MNDELDELRAKVDKTFKSKTRRRNILIGVALIAAVLTAGAWFANRNPGTVPYIWNPNPASSPASA